MSGKRNEAAWQHRWWRLKVTAWGVGVCGVVLYAVRLVNGVAQYPDQVAEQAASAMTFMYVWGLLPLWTQAVEAKGASTRQVLEDTGRRIGRAAIGRTVANAAGIYFARAVVYVLVFPSRPALLIPAVLTFGAAMIAAGHKTWTWLRRQGPAKAVGRRHPAKSPAGTVTAAATEGFASPRELVIFAPQSRRAAEPQDAVAPNCRTEAEHPERPTATSTQGATRRSAGPVTPLGVSHPPWRPESNRFRASASTGCYDRRNMGSMACRTAKAVPTHG
jgi:hypothetical protein